MEPKWSLFRPHFYKVAGLTGNPHLLFNFIDSSFNNGNEYRKMVTCLSLVNKANQDIDVQMADAMALIAGLRYEIEIGDKKKQLTKIERMKLKLLERKLSDTKNSSLFEVLI